MDVKDIRINYIKTEKNFIILDAGYAPITHVNNLQLSFHHWQFQTPINIIRNRWPMGGQQYVLSSCKISA
jgi:hypothetical protein